MWKGCSPKFGCRGFSEVRQPDFYSRLFVVLSASSRHTPSAPIGAYLLGVRQNPVAQKQVVLPVCHHPRRHRVPSGPRKQCRAREEPSWRGYALTRLQTGRSALFASLILGVLIAGWHLPLMVVEQVHYWDMGTILGAVVVFNWVFNSANGSVLILMLMHAMNNTISGSFFSPMFTGADSVGQVSLLAAVWCAAAVVVVLWAGPEHLSRKHRKQEEPPRTESAASIAAQTQDAR